MTNKFLIGADPELFIIDKTGQPFPAIGIIEGDKEHPFPISDIGHSIQVDNVMLEFNIPPRNNPTDTWKDIQFVLNHFNSILSPMGMKTSIEASAIFDPKHLTSEKAQEFGCDPDYNVWIEKMNDAPSAGGNLRTAGGHIHIGYDNPNMNTSSELVKLFDLFLTLPSLLLDKDERRRQMYGKAGAFRFKNYGVECRQLSNFWIADESYVKMVYEQIDKMFSFLNDNGSLKAKSKLGKTIVRAINENDKFIAEKIIKDYKILE